MTKQEIVEKLQKKVGIPIDEEGVRLQEAAAEVMSGSKLASVEKHFGVTSYEISRYIKKSLPTEEERYNFLEDCMLTNSVLAMSTFQRNFELMLPLDAAKAASIFASKAIEIRKARNDGFREPPVSVNTIVSLEKTLKTLAERSITK